MKPLPHLGWRSRLDCILCQEDSNLLAQDRGVPDCRRSLENAVELGRSPGELNHVAALEDTGGRRRASTATGRLRPVPGGSGGRSRNLHHITPGQDVLDRLSLLLYRRELLVSPNSPATRAAISLQALDGRHGRFLPVAAFHGHRCTATALSTWGMPAYQLKEQILKEQITDGRVFFKMPFRPCLFLSADDGHDRCLEVARGIATERDSADCTVMPTRNK